MGPGQGTNQQEYRLARVASQVSSIGAHSREEAGLGEEGTRKVGNLQG